MRRTTLSAAVCLLSLLVWACGDHHGVHETGAQEPGAESHGLMLNAGQKWQMDDHTRSMFATMVDRLEDPGAESVGPQELGKILEADLDALIQGCTMTGDAHGELHKYLVEFIPAIQQLASEGGDDEVQEVKRLLAEYPQYFE